MLKIRYKRKRGVFKCQTFGTLQLREIRDNPKILELKSYTEAELSYI